MNDQHVAKKGPKGRMSQIPDMNAITLLTNVPISWFWLVATQIPPPAPTLSLNTFASLFMENIDSAVCSSSSAMFLTHQKVKMISSHM